jgi:hypothetical protein
VPEEEKKLEPQASENHSETGEGQATSAASASPRLPFKNWDALRAEIVAGVRRSERLTKEDLSIRINAKK